MPEGKAAGPSRPPRHPGPDAGTASPASPPASGSVPGRYGALVQVLALGGLSFGGATALRRAGRRSAARGALGPLRRWPVAGRRTEDGRLTGVSACQHGQHSGRLSRPVPPGGDDVWPATVRPQELRHTPAPRWRRRPAQRPHAPDGPQFARCRADLPAGGGRRRRRDRTGARRHARRSLGHTEVMDSDAGASAWPCTSPSGCSFPS